MNTHPATGTAGVRGLQWALTVVFAIGLAACGHADAPPAATAAPDAASVIATSDTPHAAGRRDDPLRVPADGTLHYTVVLTGELHATGKHAGEKRDATIHRKIEITTRMHAVLGNGSLADANADHPKNAKPVERPNTALDDLARQSEACKDDATCMMRISMKLMADKDARKQIEEGGRQASAMIGRVAVYSQRAPCNGRASIDDGDDRATWWEDAGEGYYKTGLDKRKTVAHADAPFDCKPHLFSDDPAVADHLIAEGTLLYLDKRTGEYDITIAPQRVDATITVNGKPSSARIGTPKIVLTGFKGAAIDTPISGKQSLDIEKEDGVPLHATITWTFTPDRS